MYRLLPILLMMGVFVLPARVFAQPPDTKADTKAADPTTIKAAEVRKEVEKRDAEKLKQFELNMLEAQMLIAVIGCVLLVIIMCQIMWLRSTIEKIAASGGSISPPPTT